MKPPRSNFTLRSAHALLRVILAFSLAAAVTSVGADVSAQGRCNCNNGCHAYPGQCVLRGGAGCETGYAPFCGTRATSCPQNSSWVSCNGECQCVRIPGFDAGVPDGGSPPPTDSSITPPRDVTTVADIGVPPRDVTVIDAPPVTTDVPADRSTPPPVDAPGVDRPTTPADVSTPPVDAPGPRDVPVSPVDAPVAPTDAPAAPADASVPGDQPETPEEDAGPCECPSGVCVAGRCITDRCQYSPELGFVCNVAGTACRLIGGEPYCVPFCLGVRCEAGQFCDRSSGGACVTDNCAMIQCPAGLTCYRNQCGRTNDGGFVAEGDGGLLDASAPADGALTPPLIDDGGCGCRAGSPGGHSTSGALLLVAGVCVIARRRARQMASARK
jgi:hypothetical protein